MNRDPIVAARAELDACMAMRADELHSNPRELACAAYELADIGMLEDLIGALTAKHDAETALDRIVLSQDEAARCLDRWVNKVVEWEFRDKNEGDFL